MKIAFEVQPLLDNEKTGIGYYTDNLVRRLIHNYPESRFSLEYFTFRSREAAKKHISEYESSCTHQNVCLFPRSVYIVLSMFFYLPYRWFFTSDADIRHFFNFIIPPFTKGKNVVTIHDLGFKRFPETVRTKTKILLKLGLARSIKRADLIISDSEFTKQEILYFYPCAPEKIQVLYAGVDKQKYHDAISKEVIDEAKSNNGIHGEYILYLGTLEPRKNIKRLVAAYARLKQKHADAPILVIAGKKGWLYDDMFQEAKTHSIIDQVHFTGYVDERDKPGILAGALFFCFPSLYEGFGLPPLEAMACGTPVIASNAASLPEVVGDAGLLVNPFSVDELVNAMENLWLDKNLRKSLSTKGLAQAARFDWEQAAAQLFTLYETLFFWHNHD